MHILEALGGPRERIRKTTASAELPRDIHKLNLLAIEVVAAPDARITTGARIA